jgi:hypothetical protein
MVMGGANDDKSGTNVLSAAPATPSPESLSPPRRNREVSSYDDHRVFKYSTIAIAPALSSDQSSL